MNLYLAISLTDRHSAVPSLQPSCTPGTGRGCWWDWEVRQSGRRTGCRSGQSGPSRHIAGDLRTFVLTAQNGGRLL